jgi:hypothetical protein
MGDPDFERRCAHKTGTSIHIKELVSRLQDVVWQHVVSYNSWHDERQKEAQAQREVIMSDMKQMWVYCYIRDSSVGLNDSLI